MDDENTKDREFVYAKIDVPGPNKLWAVSVHLLTKNAKTRNEEATEHSGYIKSKVPDNDYLVIGGDFSTNNIDESAIHTLADLVDTTHVPADQSGKAGIIEAAASHMIWSYGTMTWLPIKNQ